MKSLHLNISVAKVLCLILLLTLTFQIGLYAGPNNEANISCGQPTKSGKVTAYVYTKKNGVAKTVKWSATILSTDTPEQKAKKIRDAAPKTNPRFTIQPANNSNVVSAKAKDGWTIKGMGILKDGTNEDDTYNVFAVVMNEHGGLLSLDSVATGLDAFGNQGYVAVSVGAANIQIPTYPGMMASEIEEIIMEFASFNGVMVYPIDYLQMEQQFDQDSSFFDGMGILFQDVDSNGLHIDVKDVGLIMDMSGLVLIQEDNDNDGLSDGEGFVFGTDVNNPDTDGDGFTDGQEIGMGTNPLIPDFPLDCNQMIIDPSLVPLAEYPIIPLLPGEALSFPLTDTAFDLRIVPPVMLDSALNPLCGIDYQAMVNYNDLLISLVFHEAAPYYFQLTQNGIVEGFMIEVDSRSPGSGGTGGSCTSGPATEIPCGNPDIAIVSSTLGFDHTWGDKGKEVDNIAEAKSAICDKYAANGNQPVKVTIDAHGSSGSIEIGNEVLDINNLSSFTNGIENKISELTILACSVGEGQDGIEFLCALEMALGCNVKAYTGTNWDTETDPPKWFTAGEERSWEPTDDLDGDGITDYDEVSIYGTDPFNADTDGDGYSDYEELFINGTDPTVFDTPQTCDQPSGLTVTPVAMDAVTVSWNDQQNANATQIQYRIHPSYGGGGNGTAVVTNGQSSKTINGLVPGMLYQMRVKHICGTAGNSPWKFKTFFVGEFQKMDETALDISLYPNPARDVLNVTYQSAEAANIQVRVFDMLGKTALVQNREVKAGNQLLQLDVRTLNSGLYMLEITRENGKVSKQFVVAD